MKRFALGAVVCFLRITCLDATVSSDLNSFEARLQRLERDSGIDVRKEQTTVFFSGEFIYWKPSLDGVAYATTAKFVTDPSGNQILDGYKTRTVHFDYSPAFQIGLGVGLPRDHWDIAASWLRSISTGKDTAYASVDPNSGNRLILDSIGLIQPLTAYPSSAEAFCKVHINVIDVVLGRTFVWSNYFSFRPYGGVRGIFMHINWDVSFIAPFVIPSSTDQTATSFTVANQYGAGGFIGGFNSKWNLYKGFGMFSNASAALVFGKSSEKTKQEYETLLANQTQPVEQTLTAYNTINALKALFELTIGLKWDVAVHKSTQLSLWAGYDFFYWPNITQKTVVQSTRIRERADLSFQGFVAGATIDF